MIARAARRPASLWIAALALAAGGGIARAVFHLLPASGGDVARARALGIVSVTTIAGHSKSAETLAFDLALLAALAASVGLWLLWARRGGRETAPETTTPRKATKTGTTPRQVRQRASAAAAAAPRARAKAPPLSRGEILLAAVIITLLFARLWTARTAYFAPWIVQAEEGEMLAWVNTVLRGGVLSRDVFCLYGPLSTWAVAGLFHVFGPSVGLWRSWIFFLNAPALLATYLLLRVLGSARVTAWISIGVVALLCCPAVPAMSWSLARVGLALATFACLTRALSRPGPRMFAAGGALLATTLLYSQEVGVAAAIGVAAVLLVPPMRPRDGLPIAAGAALVLVPCVALLIWQHALAATVDNLFLFPRTRLLGFAALPFPALAPTAEALRAYFVPAVIVLAGFATALRWLRGQRDIHTRVEAGLVLFSFLLFNSALSRPDDTHLAFALPPALVLLAVLVERAARTLAAGPQRLAGAARVALGLAMLAPWWDTAVQTAKSFPPSSTHAGLRPLQLPRGGGAYVAEDLAGELEQVTRAIQERTLPDEPIWVFPNEALVYFLADRPQPTRYPLGLFAVTQAQRLELVTELERSRPRYAVVFRPDAGADGIVNKITMPELCAYLDATYEPEQTIGRYSLLRRKR